MTFNFLGPGLTVNVEAKVKEQIILDSSGFKEEPLNEFEIAGIANVEIPLDENLLRFLRKPCKIRNFSQSPFGGFIFEESDGNFPSGRN